MWWRKHYTSLSEIQKSELNLMLLLMGFLSYYTITILTNMTGQHILGNWQQFSFDFSLYNVI